MTTGTVADDHTITAEPAVTAERTLTAERGVWVSVTGALDSAALAALRTHLDAAAGDPDTDYVALDLSGATDTEPALFIMLADIEARLAARAARLVVIGLHHGVLASWDEATLWAVFTLYSATRTRLASACAIPSPRAE